MEFPKDVICIADNDNWGIGKTPIPGPHPSNGKVYKATGRIIENGVSFLILEEFYYGYDEKYFKDLDDINIEEVTEILKEELCQI